MTDTVALNAAEARAELAAAKPALSVDLDWAGDEGYTAGDLSTLPELTKDAAEAGIAWRIVNPAGPGGGWPIVRFYGEENELEAFLLTYFNA